MPEPDRHAPQNLDCEGRFDYFLNCVDDSREIWILVNANREFLKIVAEEEGFEYVPVWPSAELASAYAGDAPDLQAQNIALPQFLQKWVPGLTRDGIEVGVFPVADGSVWLSSAEELRDDLQSL